MNTLGLLSFLHESPSHNSATRRFRNQPVLTHTLARLSTLSQIPTWTLLCWEDQQDAIRACVGDSLVTIHNKGPRTPLHPFDALTTATKWLDGWRGGLLQTADFDAGFHAPSLLQLATSNPQPATLIDSLLLIDPSSALVDPALLSILLSHAEENPDENLIFTPAAPGLSGILLRLPLLKQLAAANSHPGRLLAYLQDQPGKDPIARPCCAPVPTPAARTTKRFKLDSTRQIHRLSQTFHSLNGQLRTTSAEQLIDLANADHSVDPLPREITLELTTTRHTNPIFSPFHYTKINRPNLDPSLAAHLFAELAEFPDTRITFAGAGDPLLHPQFDQIISSAHAAGLTSLHLETDLAGVSPDRIVSLAALPLDLISFHIPALTQPTYAEIMGLDAFMEVLENLKTFVTARHAAGRGVPLIIPTFVKCRDNLHEMEAWYDQWLRVLGSAAITAPTPHNNVVPAESIGISHMTPPKRRPCSRLWSRLAILSDGTAVRCEQDICHPTPIAKLPTTPIKQIWTQLQDLRTQHLNNQHPGPCATCPEWHRP